MQRYKIESNSQRVPLGTPQKTSCCLYAKIQNWKQFTTVLPEATCPALLLLICKDTKLKAIHNLLELVIIIFPVVAYMQRYKIESNSQHISTYQTLSEGCCLYAKIQNWKQFTTYLWLAFQYFLLLLICKDTKLKAIHNNPENMQKNALVVAYMQRYKIESNSQHVVEVLPPG